MLVIEVFADIWCPFAHVGLSRLVQRRDETGADFALHVRAWPLELINGKPLDGPFIGEEIVELRDQVSPDLFVGFDVSQFPTTSLPALALAAAAYERDVETGERVSMTLRRALFEEGRDISSAAVLADVAASVGLDVSASRPEQVQADWDEGKARGAIGSPHFFVGGESFFCPTLEIRRVDGHLQISFDRPAFEAFVERCVR